MKMLRLALLGSGGVGKTSLLYQFMNGFFSDNYQPTIEDSYRHFVQLPDGITHSIEILDTAGMHQFPAMRQLSIQSSQAFVVVYAINNQQSFHEAIRLAETITEVKGEESTIPLVLIGNKTDLEMERQVCTAEAEIEARKRNFLHVETCARNNEAVNKAFMDLLIKVFGVTDKPEQNRKSSFSKLGRRLSAGIMRRNSDSDNNNVEGDCTIL